MMRRPKDAWSDKWWLPLGIPTKWLVRLETLDDVVPYLRAIPSDRIAELQVRTTLCLVL